MVSIGPDLDDGRMDTDQLPPPTIDDAARPPTGDPAPTRTSPLRRGPALSAAGWLAATGAGLLLVAAIVVVASRWQAINPEVRFSGLVAALLAVFFVAEAGRRDYPSTSTALASLAATLTAPVGIAAAATLSQPWPVCILVGGIAALVATEAQSRRWDVGVLKAATVAGAGLTATGLAGLTDVPVGVLVAGAAAVALVLGAVRRSIVLSVAVGCAPALLALDAAGVGRGTLARIGATGPSLAWSAPIAGGIAALVLGAIAHRRRELALVGLSVATLASGVLVGLGHGEVGAVAWWCLPALVLLAAEAVAVLGGRSVWADAAAKVAPFIALPVAVGGLVAPLGALVGRTVAEFGGGSVDPGWAIPLALTAVALGVATVGSSRRSGRAWRVTGTYAAAAAAAYAAVMMTGETFFGWPEVAMLGAIAITTGIAGAAGRPRWVHAAAVLAVADLAAALGAGGLDGDGAVLLLLAVTAALTGVAFLRADVTPIDTAAVSVAVLLVVVAPEATTAALHSIAIAMASGQWLLYSLLQRARLRSIATGGVFGGSLVSLWWTTGTNDRFLSVVERFGADETDVALGVATTALLVIGMLIRRLHAGGGRAASSWLAYSPGLGMAAAWLLEAQLDATTAWATFTALGVGIVATAVGGLRRLGAPLVIGTGMIAGTVAISAGPRLAAAPTWAWIAMGGIGLLTLAALIERSNRPTVGASGGEGRSLVDQFRQDFD